MWYICDHLKKKETIRGEFTMTLFIMTLINTAFKGGNQSYQ